MIVGLVVSNVLYPGIAVVVAVVLALFVGLRHRRPRSVEANVASFNKGLRALAPDEDEDRAPTTEPSWGGPRRATVVTRPISPRDEAGDEAAGGAPDPAPADQDRDIGGVTTEEAETG